MKRLYKTVLLFTGILFLASCAEEERDPQIYLLKFPNISSPSGTKSYILEEAKAGDVMETYSWSDNIKQAVIKNQKGHSLIFNHEEIAPGETKVFTPDTHKQGLFSPDCYNGKSLFTMGDEDAEKED